MKPNSQWDWPTQRKRLIGFFDRSWIPNTPEEKEIAEEVKGTLLPYFETMAKQYARTFAKEQVEKFLKSLKPQYVAMLFHEAYEANAPHYGYHTKPESAGHWDDVPRKNKRLMTKTAGIVLNHLLAKYTGEEK